MSKMCSLSKAMRSTDGELYVSLMNKPKYYCKRCGRVANEKDYLCRPYPLVEENKDDYKIKEVEIAVTRNGMQKHYVVEKKEEVAMNGEKLSNDCGCKEVEETQHECNCTPEDNCGDNCRCQKEGDGNVVHVADLFKNEDGSYSDEWIAEDIAITDEVPVKETEEIDPFIKSLAREVEKKDKKIKKMKMSELREIIREEIKKYLAGK